MVVVVVVLEVAVIGPAVTGPAVIGPAEDVGTAGRCFRLSVGGRNMLGVSYTEGMDEGGL